MIEETHWHPVAASTDVVDRPLAVRLLGRDLVLWRDGAGALQAWIDRCPHRGSRLSLGQVRDGLLECAYHGWRFAPSGQCVLVPALPSFAPPPTHCVPRFEAQEAYGGYRESIALFICPLETELSRVWFRLAVADFDSSEEQLRAFQHQIFMQDQPILESQSPRLLPLELRNECHTSADKASSAYRRHLRSLRISFGVLP